ncbi:chorismate pyruvate-lyase family protein [Bacillus sp. WLY-B-L8]|uniref:chorismate pyruvate-lyase family protein n=1 Tax=Bacillus multifaciens TaxID=3068506 RepID=UPI002741DFF5|nr:chorismate pyruvate-lyase family protein [Bacillus sp. WLY-B-L8]MDP7977694.1 chorismate pyruvate-lyase family protein [Bacillus sp. WLY-B-L8]
MNTNLLEKRELEIVRNFLLGTDGSTTKAIEILVGQDVTLEVYEQEIVSKNELPKEISIHFLGKKNFLKRTSTLKIGTQNASHNIVYADLEFIPEEVVQELKNETLPIGKLIKNFETRREIISSKVKNIEPYKKLLNKAILPATTYPVKEYKILQENCCLFYIFELFEETCISNHLK